jgi:hypothetical protein
MAAPGSPLVAKRACCQSGGAGSGACLVVERGRESARGVLAREQAG